LAHAFDGRFDVYGVKKRRAALKGYLGVMPDSYFVDPRGAYKDVPIETKDKYLATNTSGYPPRFQNFYDYNTHTHAPGKTPHHPGYKHHELTAYLFAYKMAEAVEYVVASREELLREVENEESGGEREILQLPNATDYRDLFVFYGCGAALQRHSCWTSFLPSDESINLKAIVDFESSQIGDDHNASTDGEQHLVESYLASERAVRTPRRGHHPHGVK